MIDRANYLRLTLTLVVLAAGCTVPANDDDAGANRDANVDGSIAEDASGPCPRCEGVVSVACDGTRATCDAVCFEGSCLACTPERAYCDGGHDVRMCSANGSPGALITTCAADEVCIEGACAQPCMATESEDGESPSMGCEFVAVPTLNSALGGQWRQFMDFVTLGADGFHFAVALANPQSYPVTATIEGRDVSITRELAPGGIETVTLPWVLPVTQPYPGGIPTTGVYGPFRTTPSVHEPHGSYRIVTNGPIVAYQFNPLASYDDDPSHTTCLGGATDECHSFTNDASLLLPVHALGRRYTVLAYGTRFVTETCGPDFGVVDERSSYLTIVATVEGSTEVTVTPSTWLRAGAGRSRMLPGVPTTFTLVRGDVLQLVADHPTDEECDPIGGASCAVPCSSTGDVTGTRIEADRGVAVFSGHDCAQVPMGTAACDHLEDQLWPDEALGRSYVLLPAYAPVGAVRTLTIGRIVATQGDTHVTLSPPASGISSATLARGEVLELELYGPVEVTADAPVAAAQFLVGDALTDLSSDPSMVVAVPNEQWRTEYPILVPSSYPESWLTIAAPIGSAVSVGGERTTPYERTEHFEISYVPVTPGVLALIAGSPFTVLVSGHGPYVSYAYPGGGNLEVLE